MPEPQTYIERLIARVAGFGAGRRAKTLIVVHAATVRDVNGAVARLQLGEHVVVRELDAGPQGSKSAVAPALAPILPVDPQFHAVLIAADGPHTMIRLGRACAAYQRAKVPVVVVMGWAPPMDAGQFRVEATDAGFLNAANMFDLAAAYCKGALQGDILEFGTFQGFTLQCAYHGFHRRQNAHNRRFIAFDSFAGIAGANSEENFADGDFATSETSFRFSNFLAEVPDERVVTVSGPYATTLGTNAAATRKLLEPVQAALVHIDCDVQAPAKLALDFVTPYLQQGTLLMFDEYDQHQASNTMGERAALRAWLAENPAFEVEPYRAYHVRARSFIVHRRG